MAIPLSTDYDTIPTSALLGPGMSAAPLSRILANANWLYRYFRPPLLSVAPMIGSVTRGTSFTVGVRPSADGIRYRFRHWLLPTFNGTMTVAVAENTGTDPSVGWSDIYAATATPALTSGTWHAEEHVATVSASARMLRFRYTGPGGGGDVYFVGGVLAVPDPTDASVTGATAQKACGWRVYDDGLLSMAGAPITTEHIDRCRRNAVSVLLDRAQCVATLVQEDGSLGNPKWRVTSTQPRRLGRAVASVPGQTVYTLQVRVLARVSGGSGTGLVRVMAGGASAVLNASGQLESTTLAVAGTGTLTSALDVDVWAQATAGNTTDVHSVHLCWVPGDVAMTYPLSGTGLTICGTDVAPPAAMAYLLAADGDVRGVAAMQWCQPGHMADTLKSGQTARRFAVSVPIGSRHAIVRLVRSGSGNVPGSGTTPAPILAGDTDGGLVDPNREITPINHLSLGDLVYLHAETTPAPVTLTIESSPTINDAAVAPADRALAVLEDTTGVLEDVEVRQCSGFGLAVFDAGL